MPGTRNIIVPHLRNLPTFYSMTSSPIKTTSGETQSGLMWNESKM